jgi:diaminopimelate epimerase
MMETIFYKYEGAGNDFIMIDNRNGFFNEDSNVIARLCDRHFGIGADGLILMESHAALDFSMKYFNADGREGSMCGNGGRCVAWFARQLGIDKTDFTFRATDGLHMASILSHQDNTAIVKLHMKDIAAITKQAGYTFVDSGSPHILIEVDNVDAVDVAKLGREIRYSPAFAKLGVNVNFMQIVANGIKLRTYERGVEDETLACGTGSVAAATALLAKDSNFCPPVNIMTRGGRLKVYAKNAKQGFSDIWLEGPARMVFEGKINISEY